MGVFKLVDFYVWVNCEFIVVEGYEIVYCVKDYIIDIIFQFVDVLIYIEFFFFEGY